MKRVTRYVVQEVLVSFFVGFAFFFVLFVINQVLVIAQRFIDKQIALWDTLMLLVYSLPTIAALSFPFGTLIGVLMGLGKLSSSNEILAIQASGISLKKIFLPLIIFGLLLSFASFVVNDYFLPLGTLNYVELFTELLYSNSQLILEPFSGTNFDQSFLYSGPIEEGEVQGLFLLDNDERGNKRIVYAQRAKLLDQEQQLGALTLAMEDVVIHSAPQGNHLDFEATGVQDLRYSFLIRDVTSSIRNPGPREMSTVDLRALIQEREDRVGSQRRAELQAQSRSLVSLLSGEQYRTDYTVAFERYASIKEQLNKPFYDRNLRLYQLEYWKKYAIPIACATFIVLGFPLGLLARKSGRTLGFFLGLLGSALYWVLIVVTGSMTDTLLQVPSWIIIFAPNALMLFIGFGVLSARRRF